MVLRIRQMSAAFIVVNSGHFRGGGKKSLSSRCRLRGGVQRKGKIKKEPQQSVQTEGWGTKKGEDKNVCERKTKLACVIK